MVFIKRRESYGKTVTVMSRRRFLALSGSAGVVAAIGGCGYYPPEKGAAYKPWEWPDGESEPEWTAVGGAILAANPHNSQPWRFEIRDKEVQLHADLGQSLGPLDPFHREMYLGLGCSLENLEIAARDVAYDSIAEMLPGDDETFVGRVLFDGESASVSSRLVEAIPNRHTNRGPYVDSEVPTSLESDLNGLIRESDVSMTFLYTKDDKETFSHDIVEATKAIIDDKEMNEESHRWYRHSEEAIDTHRDGLTIDPLGVSATIRYLGKIGSRPDAEKAAKYWLKNTIRHQTTAGAYGVLSCPERGNRAGQLQCGRIYQRMHLFATSVGLAMQPLNQMLERADREAALGIEPVFQERLHDYLGDDKHAVMVFRIGYPIEKTFASCRKPIEWVASEGGAL